MPTTTDIGRSGEEAARNYLAGNGFRIRHTNWRYGHKELDIVASKNNTLHIIEVKTRAPQCHNPLAAMNKQKQRNTIAAANAYAQRFGIEENIQLDVIVVLTGSHQSQVQYIPNAYHPYC